MAKQPSKGRSSKTSTGKKAAKSTEKGTNTEAETVAPVTNESTLADEIRAAESIAAKDPQLTQDGEPEPQKRESVSADEPLQSAQPEPEPAVETDAPKSEPETRTVAVDATQPVKSGPGFIPLVLGGLFAGLIGYGIATWQYPQDTGISEADLARIADLEAQVANLPAAPDLSGIEVQLATLSAGISAIDPQIAELQSRIEVIERQPSGDGTLQETALAAYQRDIDVLRDQIADQQAELQQMADAAVSQLDETRAEALAIEQNAVDAARAATARAALAQVQAALESGAPIGASLAELGDVLDAPIPDALTAVTDGAPTLAALQDSFPDAARSALATARMEGADGEGSSGLGAFLRSQFEVRSVTPREGDSVDAVLSRAEATLRAGRLNDTLAEVAALPEVSRAELSEWIATAEQRAAALEAADELAASLNAN